jgi:hypothetical protein
MLALRLLDNYLFEATFLITLQIVSWRILKNANIILTKGHGLSYLTLSYFLELCYKYDTFYYITITQLSKQLVTYSPTVVSGSLKT